jgi:hypothetical protein
MPKGTARSHSSSGEYVSHFNGVRIRVNGTGALKLTLYSLDDQEWEQLADVEMAERTSIIPTVLANFISQRCSLEIKTTTINDYFKINRIIIFSKFFASEYPM